MMNSEGGHETVRAVERRAEAPGTGRSPGRQLLAVHLTVRPAAVLYVLAECILSPDSPRRTAPPCIRIKTGK